MRNEAKFWQESAIKKLVSFCEANEDVLALILFGSCSTPEAQFDFWSDIDILLVVKADSLSSFFPTTVWLEHFGMVYSYHQSSDEFINITRVCYEDFRRIDLVITTEEKFSELKKWPRNPFYFGMQILFLRSLIVDRVVRYPKREPQFVPRSEAQFQSMVREFRFKSMLAVYKVVRNDLLIAVHLALDLVQDCCLLGMILRDRIEGTNIHKEGGVGNPIVADLPTAQKPFTSSGILEIVEESNILFEKLACEWSSEYQENRQPLLAWVARAKDEIIAD